MSISPYSSDASGADFSTLRSHPSFFCQAKLWNSVDTSEIETSTYRSTSSAMSVEPIMRWKRLVFRDINWNVQPSTLNVNPYLWLQHSPIQLNEHWKRTRHSVLASYDWLAIFTDGLTWENIGPRSRCEWSMMFVSNVILVCAGTYKGKTSQLNFCQDLLRISVYMVLDMCCTKVTCI